MLFRSKRLIAKDADFTKLDFFGLELSESVLSSSNFEGARFIDTNFSMADLFCANANDADFTRSKFDRADLRGANLLRAKLVRATLPKADLRAGQVVKWDGGNKVTVQNAGVYQIDFIAQFQNSSGSNVQVSFWIRKNGADVPNSAQEVQFTGGSGGISDASWLYLLNLAAGDYIQFYWYTTVSTVSLAYQAAGTTPVHPASPSIMVNFTQVYEVIMLRPLAHHPHQMAGGLASLGRGNDSMLVHMTPHEVGGLRQLAMAAGGDLTINPHTGLPEAGFLSSILPMVAGLALDVFAPGIGTAIGDMLGGGVILLY